MLAQLVLEVQGPIFGGTTVDSQSNLVTFMVFRAARSVPPPSLEEEEEEEVGDHREGPLWCTTAGQP